MDLDSISEYTHAQSDIKGSSNYMTEGYIINKGTSSEEVILIPYNINNILVNENHIMDLLKNNNVDVEKINHIKYFQQAFTHKSYIKKDIFPKEVLEAAKKELGNPVNLLELRDESYERIEYLGDRVLKIMVSFYLFIRYPKEDEGFMTRLQTKIEDKTNLAIWSKKLSLEKYFIISQQIESLNGRTLEKLHEDIFEAFMGALFLSNGFEACAELIINLLETQIDYSEKLYQDNNYKDILLRYYHKQKFIHPKYHMIHKEGPAHKRTYIMGVERGSATPSTSNNMEEKCNGFGVGMSKRQGEQNAAKMALIGYGFLNKDQYTNKDIFYPDWEAIERAKLEELEKESEDFESNICNSLSKINIRNSKDSKLEDENNDLLELEQLEKELEIDDYSNVFS